MAKANIVDEKTRKYRKLMDQIIVDVRDASIKVQFKQEALREVGS